MSAPLTTHAHLAGTHRIWTHGYRLLPGLTLTGAISFAAIELSHTNGLQSNGISALTLAIVLGMVVGNTVYRRIGAVVGDGVIFSKTNLLRWGIILYGLRLTFQDIGNVGWSGVAIDATMVCSTFALACFLGTRVFGLDSKTTMLIGAGSSICGAAAVMAAEPVVRGKGEQVTVAVAAVVLFGTLAMFLYPALYQLNTSYQFFSLSPTAYGVYAGSTIHEVAQVVAAGHAVGEQATDTAVITKMVRVMMLAPFLVSLSIWLSHTKKHEKGVAGHNQGTQKCGIIIPWFALGFIAVAGLNSLAKLPVAVVSCVTEIDSFLLAMAMTGLGLSTHVSAIRKAGIKPLALAALLFIWLVCGGLAINTGMTILFK